MPRQVTVKRSEVVPWYITKGITRCWEVFSRCPSKFAGRCWSAEESE